MYLKEDHKTLFDKESLMNSIDFNKLAEAIPDDDLHESAIIGMKYRDTGLSDRIYNRHKNVASEKNKRVLFLSDQHYTALFTPGEVVKLFQGIKENDVGFERFSKEHETFIINRSYRRDLFALNKAYRSLFSFKGIVNLLGDVEVGSNDYKKIAIHDESLNLAKGYGYELGAFTQGFLFKGNVHIILSPGDSADKKNQTMFFIVNGVNNIKIEKKNNFKENNEYNITLKGISYSDLLTININGSKHSNEIRYKHTFRIEELFGTKHVLEEDVKRESKPKQIFRMRFEGLDIKKIGV